MKKLALALVFGALSMGAVSAQTVQKSKVKADRKEVKVKQEVKGASDKKHVEKTPEERADRQVKRMTEDLKLTDDQAVRIREISLRKSQQMSALKGRNADNKEAMKAEMMQIKNAYQGDLKTILTPEQLEKHEALKAERKAKMKGKHEGQKDNGLHKGHYKGKSKK